jgi:hypothetical protein
MPSGEHNRVLQTTLSEYVLGAEDQTMRKRKLLALMKAKGRVTFNHEGKALDWGIEYKEREIEGYADGDTLTYVRSDLHARVELPWRGYTMTDMVTKKERLMNRGKAALIKYVSEMAESMMKNFTTKFHSQLYIDGNASGNAKKIHGFDSFTAATVSAGNKVATPNDTYAGRSTVLGAYGGSWAGTWPVGTGDSEYDHWSPIIVDYTNTGWTHATKTWPNTCQEAMRFAVINAKRNDDADGMIDIIMLDRELFRQWADQQDDKERIIVGQGSGKPTLRNLGFGDTIYFEGAEVTWEYGVPTDAAGEPQGYLFNVDEMELCSLQDRLFVSNGPYYDENHKADKYDIDFFGNMKFNPRHQGKLAKYS